MYCNFYGLSERPFEITPDPKFLYLTPSGREILASLIYGIRERRGFATMVGEPGTGKTTLLRALLDWLDKKVRVAFIFNTDVTFEDMLNMALLDLGLANPEESVSKVNALKRLNDFAIQQSTKGGNVAFIVDEAQNLDRRAMENFRLLSNMETRKHKLIQIVFSGQPELEEKLSQPELRQLAQRISLKRYVTPLPEKETMEYIQHRLAIANCDDPDLFNLRSKQLIWEYSGGVPRKINILCDNALLAGYGLKEKRIKGHIVEETIKGLNWSHPSDRTVTRAVAPVEKESPLPWYASPRRLLIAACVILILGFLIGTFWFKYGKEKFLPWSKDAQTENTNQTSRSVPPEIASDVVFASAPEEKTESVSDVIPEKAEVTVNNIGETTESWRSVIVQGGDSFSKLVASVYGRATPDNLALVIKYNPDIKDVNRLEVGQKIIFPPPYGREEAEGGRR